MELKLGKVSGVAFAGVAMKTPGSAAQGLRRGIDPPQVMSAKYRTLVVPGTRPRGRPAGYRPVHVGVAQPKRAHALY